MESRVRMAATCIVICMMVLSSPHFVQAKKAHAVNRPRPRHHAARSKVPSTREEVIASFLSWVAAVDANYSKRALQPPGGLLTNPSAKAVARVIVVDQSGRGHFRTIQEAVNAVPSHNSLRVVIEVNAGVYYERVLIPKSKPYITLQGAGMDRTTIVCNLNSATAGSTYRSATVGISANYFVARDISFKNSAPAPPAGAVNMQAVALRITGDCAAFYNCGFYGAQDTLYDDLGRHYFKNCEIVGSIDFIFGNAQSLYKGCALKVTADGCGSVTAQKRVMGNQNTGFAFVGCSVSGSGQVYLGRAWGPYSRVVFAFTYMQDIVLRAGWQNWNIPQRQRTTYYGQYKCSGPGATEVGRVAWSHELSPAEAAPFLSLSFIDGQYWVPEP